MRWLIPRDLRRHLRALVELRPRAAFAYVRLLLQTHGRDRRPFPAPIRSMLFVCHGNIMRSAFAAALWRQRVDKGANNLTATVAVSAGMHATPGTPADPSAIEVAAEYGVSLDDHGATPISTRLLDDADLVIAMDLRNAAELTAQFPDGASRVFLLGTVDAGRSVEIPDPYGTELSEVRACFHRVHECVTALASHLQRPGVAR